MSQSGDFGKLAPAADPSLSSADTNLQILARSLAHDFNNLITGILGHAALIEAIAPADDPDIGESAAIIRKTAERAAALNAQLLDLAGKSGPRVALVDVHETIREVAALVTPSLANRIHIKLDLTAEQFHVSGDPGQLHQALLNLAVNARDAMPRGGILAFATESSGGALSVWVSDTGEGIPIELHQRIFEPLFTTKSDGKGSGLGLAVVRRVVEQQSGSLELRSAPGFGTTFRLRFPVRERVTAAADGRKLLSIATGA
jgi:signal transduction histidine kinase